MTEKKGPGAVGSKFYDDAKSYWKDVAPTVDGMLGGYAHISSTDIGGSAKFLRKFVRGKNAKTKTKHALDCGAGIGRITRLLLLPLFEKVDMVESNPGFLKQAEEFIGIEHDRIQNKFCSGLEEFTPENKKYDIIWCQWVLGHLTDDDLVAFFKRCQQGLAENGYLMIKENLSSTEVTDFDEQDSSYIRPRDQYVELMEKAGLTIVEEEKQKQFPKEIYEVRMFALQ